MPGMYLTRLCPFCFHVMGCRGAEKTSLSGDINNMPISGLQRQKHNDDLECLTLASRPLKTLKFFILAIVLYVKRSVIYLLGKAGLLLVFGIPTLILGCFLSAMHGPHRKHFDEILEYFRYGLWWTSLGVASSIGLGSGLHTFVLYLGPHIALFTIKAMQCGRVDIKRAPYDTIQLKRGPSWLEKDCSEYGPPSFNLSSSSSHIPLSSILPQVQTEAILWGIGTALGELPPYFISKAAHTGGSEQSPVVELDEGDGHLKRMKYWLLSHAQYLNFFTILLLASVPNPLFDLAGIMCGQFGIPFWEFFLATFVGKAIIKTHIQTVFIISICNNQLLNWIENKLIIGVVGLVPGMMSVMPGIVTSLHAVREKYMASSRHPVPTHIKVSRWDFSFASVWNTVVLLMLTNFFVKIVNATAQRHLRKQQEMELGDDHACLVATRQCNDN